MGEHNKEREASPASSVLEEVCDNTICDKTIGIEESMEIEEFVEIEEVIEFEEMEAENAAPASGGLGGETLRNMTEVVGETTDMQTVTAADEEEYYVVERGTTTTSQAESCPSDRYSISHLAYVGEQMLKVANHSVITCSSTSIRIERTKTSGLRTTMHLRCQMCNETFEVHSLPADTREKSSVDIELSAVVAAMTAGGGYSQMEGLFSAINVPCMTKKKYRKCHDTIVDKSQLIAEEAMSAAAAEERELAIARGDILPCGTPHIPVLADGTWMKRSYKSGMYNSASGVGVIIGFYTGKVLYVGIKNRICSICQKAAKLEKEAPKHKCFKNRGRNQASTQMEGDAIAEGFKASKETHRLVYSTLIADGDTNVYKKILDCKPYGTSLRVKKIECTNHLLRNFCNKMKDVVKKTQAGYYRKMVEKSIRRMRTGIARAAAFRMNENVSIAEKIKRLHEDIVNVTSHVFGDHRRCARYFCDGSQKEDEVNIVPDLSNQGVYKKIQDIVNTLAAYSERLLYQSNINAVESFNAIVAKHIGGKRLNFGQRGSYNARVYAAVIQLNTKAVMSRLQTSLGGAPSPILKNLEELRKNEASQNARRKSGCKRTKQQFPAGKDKDYQTHKSQTWSHIYRVSQNS
ncbi:uncharacterized protein LOC143208585 [Lasioglossum baleicum]|uniref:uncharacterized protein LOC143208585 n=1 Tax=Lasioglossum baleicum TaxID=434251 RepID=UPI003FCE590E